ncbi:MULTISPECIES: SpoIIE family protein phosphatase [unclassified Janthinobacterium]|uniref:SpoIIE family protein phosphatase n=1 Tax=unclassified Janthinobacterium TaxID=2610881 RepID=UPI001611CABE|nr:MULTISPECIES: SpoIIE family protein phosphatase [unclassified Janthinobacterium]MBB5607119.1 serine phosphatase RsbU (regulator of sigma subunit) [Janthinobacterium sp. S3T4]MBB5612844.1 serine phosphatase RsbU (regulator of sigma subunit) [Janthinobacterium sp. S3M3]
MEFNASRLHLPRYRSSVAADLCIATESVQADASNFDVLELFTERRDMMSLPVTEQQRPIGLISRNIFMSQMSKPFYHEVYGKKSCIAFMDKEPLIVDSAMSIEDLTFRAVEAGEKALADGFIITEDGALAGVGFGLQLMNVVATMQAEKNRQIMHSIDYASVIQRALLRTSDAELSATLPDAHLEWQPRDVVGGDFYFFERHAGGWFAAIADCTGHGVPGAFMTLIASSALSQALRELGPHDPAALIGAVSRAIKTLLGQDGSATGSNDGMDCAFLCYDTASASLRFAGAKLTLYQLAPGGDADDAVRAIDGARMGVGYVDTPAGYCWHNETLEAPQGSLLFITTDGLLDQIGGSRDIAYGKRRMREQLLARRDGPAREVAASLLHDVKAWQGAQPRRDDLTFFCFRL